MAAASVGFQFLTFFKDGKEMRLALDEVVILRTPGGMLEVSTLVRNEEFGWKSSYQCPLFDCSWLLQATISQIRLPVHYTYRIPLSETWSLKVKGEYLELVVPREEVKLPAAADFAKMDIKTERGWLSPSVQENREHLLKELTPELNRRGAQRAYIEAQRAEGSKTVAEFARRWMVEQAVEKAKANVPIKVIFRDRSATDPF